MKRSSWIIFIVILAIIFTSFFINPNATTNAQIIDGNKIVLYQFYGEGCPHCGAEADFLENMQKKYSSLEVKRYEIYMKQENRNLFEQLSQSYGTEIKGVPTIFINDRVIIGYSSGLAKDIEKEIQNCLENECIDPLKVVEEGDTTEIIGDSSPAENPEKTEKLTLFKTVSLAIVDAVNPCALAVLTLMLIAILTYNPQDKRRVLLSGLAFTLSVFIMYFIYGLIIIKFFQIIQGLASIRYYLYKCFGVAAILLGGLNIRDYFSYRPGNIGTEMPMFMRPKIKKIIAKVTSPSGAFIVGLFVTVFLLPCTIGPYIIAGGILSAMEIIKTIPPLLLYNAIFVIPMLIIVGLITYGVAKVQEVSDWKERNIRWLHLTAGILLFGIGLGLLLNWF